MFRRSFSLAVLLLLAFPVSAIDTARLDRKPFTEEEIRHVVRHWFSLVQHNAPIDRFLALVGTPEAERVLRRAHVESLRRFRGIWPEVEKVDIRSTQDGSRQVELEVSVRAIRRDGREEEHRQRHVWSLVDDGGRLPKIASLREEKI